MCLFEDRSCFNSQCHFPSQGVVIFLIVLLSSGVSRKLRTTRAWFWSKKTNKTFMYQTEALDPLLARIKTLTLSWGCGKGAFWSPTGSHFLSFAQTCQKLCFNCWTTCLEMKFSTSPCYQQQIQPLTFLQQAWKKAEQQLWSFVCLVLDLSSFRVQDWGKNLVSLGEHFCLHYQKGCSKEMRKTFPLCPIKTPELSSLQKRGLLKNKEVLRELNPWRKGLQHLDTMTGIIFRVGNSIEHRGKY